MNIKGGIDMNNNFGQEMYELAEKLFPICRSITGNGVRETLEILKEEIPELNIKEVPSGTKVFDWTVPKEWNIKDAHIEDLYGNKIIDFKKNNLHVLGYSVPVDEIVTLEELKKHIYTEPDQPDVIPYVTSYYAERYGFCMSENQKNSMKDGKYHIVIDSDLNEAGSLTYGEIIIKGKTEEEIFISTYLCHPSMANDNLSGVCVAHYIAKYILQMKERRYTYRIIFVPETIGAITYLSENIDDMKKNIIAGFNLSCVGDDRTFSYMPTPYENTLSDKVVQNILKYYYPNYVKYTFLQRGSDERQYCSPGIELPVCAISRSKDGAFLEYHTSADDLNVISPDGLYGAFEVHRQCIMALEYNYKFEVTCLCEPQLGKRGLYPTISQKGSAANLRSMRNFIAYANGKNDLIDISNIINVPIINLIPIIDKLVENGLIDKN